MEGRSLDRPFFVRAGQKKPGEEDTGLKEEREVWG